MPSSSATRATSPRSAPRNSPPWRSWRRSGRSATPRSSACRSTVEDHGKWKRDIEAFGGAPADFPIIDDTSLTVAKAYDMLPADYYLPTEGRTPANSATVRTVYIIGPDKKIRLSMTYPMSIGRNFAEILRALDAVQKPMACRWRPPPTGCRGRT
jgi:alkyl hydroperoxide reductase subunit AhpC